MHSNDNPLGMAPRDAAAATAPAAYGTFSSATKSNLTSSSVAAAPQRHSRSAMTRQASPLSRLFFLWFGSLVDITKTRPIRIDDVFTLDADDCSAETHGLFIARMARPRDFLWTLWCLYWQSIVVSGLLALVSAVGDASNALLMYVAITEMASTETPVQVVVAVLMARHGVKVIAQLAKQHSQHLDSIVAARAISALQTLVFDAIVSSSGSTASDTSNLFYKLWMVYDLVDVVHMIWLLPLSLATNLYMLYYLLGEAVIGCIVTASGLQLLALLFSRFNKRVAARLHVYQGHRLHIMDECFKTMQSIKLHAWEHRFLRRIREYRKKERALVYMNALIDAIWRSLLLVFPEIVLAGSVVMFSSMENTPQLNPAMIFASLSILSETKQIIGTVVALVHRLPSASVTMTDVFDCIEKSPSLSRQNDIVTGRSSSSAQADPSQHDQDGSATEVPSSVTVCNASIGRSTQQALLIRMNFAVPIGYLTVIHGKTGTGKSTLLEAMIDSSLLLNPTRGFIHVRGRVAYCSQDPWLQTLSIRDNILFGLPFDEEKYLNVLHACCLMRDLGALEQGDGTAVGPKGLTLSGGQKARIALARACYADADVYLLDSPLSSVDAIVQGDIFSRCIIDLLKHKTVVLVTHNEEIVSSPFVDQVLLVKDHRVMVDPRPSNGHGGLPRNPSVMKSNRCILKMETRSLNGQPSVTTTNLGPPTNGHIVSLTRSPLCLLPVDSSRLKKQWDRLEVKNASTKQVVPSISDNDLNSASNIFKPARAYLTLCGGVLTLLVPCVVFTSLSRGGLIAGHLWISSRIQQVLSRDMPAEGVQSIEIFVVLISLRSICAVIGKVNTLTPTGKAADQLFDQMVRGVLFAPMSFFYNQPIGEIMNRFSADVRMIDEGIYYIILHTVSAFVGIIMPWIVLMTIMPEMVCVVPALVWLLYKSLFQIKAAVEIRRLVSSSHTPCFDAISEAINGRRVIQAFGPPQVARFRRDLHEYLDQLIRTKYAAGVMNNWSVLQLARIDSLLLLGFIVAVISRRDSLIPLFGFALHYLAIITTNLGVANGFLVQGASDIFKIQRVLEYCAIRPEQPDDECPPPLIVLPPRWPSRGEIVFDNVSFQYNDRSSLVLQCISLHINPGEKIGFVGRTGSGKSSLTMALFRINEVLTGRILIDGVDIGLADLYAVRSRLSIIPQSPMFFHGTLRSYLDPFEEMDDAVLWEALRKTRLASVVTRMDGKLVAQLKENADNLSQGERQLLCLSRVLLKQSSVVVLDEATAAMDRDSDEALQHVLEKEFRTTTVLSIAHRLDSIMAFDRVVVMEDGRIVQCGSVQELVSDATGPFFDLLEGALLKM